MKSSNVGHIQVKSSFNLSLKKNIQTLIIRILVSVDNSFGQHKKNVGKDMICRRSFIAWTHIRFCRRKYVRT